MAEGIVLFLLLLLLLLLNRGLHISLCWRWAGFTSLSFRFKDSPHPLLSFFLSFLNMSSNFFRTDRLRYTPKLPLFLHFYTGCNRFRVRNSRGNGVAMFLKGPWGPKKEKQKYKFTGHLGLDLTQGLWEKWDRFLVIIIEVSFLKKFVFLFFFKWDGWI